VTAAALAKMLCLASGIYGRPAWDQAKCEERADLILTSSLRHSVDPVIMVAIDVIECDMDDQDAPIYEVQRGRKRLVGWDSCPMGMRLRGPERRRRWDAAALIELAASDLGRSYAACRADRRPRSECEWRAVARRNFRNHDYAAQVMVVAGALRGRKLEGSALRSQKLASRTAEIARRLLRIFQRNT
jgi:hypothetical protein